MLNLCKIDTVKKGRFMKTLTFFALALISFSSFSNPIIFPFNCSLFHRYDNFYLSAASTMDPKLELPSAQYNDEFCWEMGKRHANESLAQAEEDWRLDDCHEAFDYGFNEGMQGSQENMQYPTYCYNIGLHSGFSALSNFAREGREDIVGRKCLKSFERGKEDGRANRPQSPGWDNKLAVCYRAGYNL